MEGDEYVVGDVTHSDHQSNQPIDRLSLIAARMLDVLNELGPEAVDLRCIIMLNNATTGAEALYGYGDASSAVADAIAFINAALKTSNRPARLIIQPLAPE